MAATLEGIAEYHRDEARTIREHAWRTVNPDAKAVLLASATWHDAASAAILAVERELKPLVASIVGDFPEDRAVVGRLAATARKAHDARALLARLEAR